MPIFIHAYPDQLNKLAARHRRDSFCGKISIMDVFRQQGIKFTALAPHVVDPESALFAQKHRPFRSALPSRGGNS